MRPQGGAQELERRRRRAVDALEEGSEVAEVARVLGVTERSVRRRLAADRDGGDGALAAVPHPGARPKLDGNQARQVPSWLKRPPSGFGLPTESWTAHRVAHLIEQRSGVAYHPRYLGAWPAKRGVTPQEPALRAGERNARRIAAWRSRTWPRLKKGRPRPARTSCSSTRAAPSSRRRSAAAWPRADAPRS